MNDIIAKTARLLELLGHDEGPFGTYYSDTEPDGFGPEPGVAFSRALEEAGEIDWRRVAGSSCCIFRNLWLARKKEKAAWLSHEACGCMGGGYFAGIYAPYLDRNVSFVSIGDPAANIEGEHYLPSKESMRAFLDDCAPPLGAGKYCVLKPLRQFSGQERPLAVVFFARPEVITGLFSLAVYTVGHHEAVASPFGAGCTNIIAWPLVYERRGLERAVLGGFDPSVRRFMGTDELSFAIPIKLYAKMLDRMEESALGRKHWERNRLKAQRSRRAWTGDPGD
jgi:hypothetical protein